MTTIRIVDASRADFEPILALNADQVQHTSPMDLARLSQLSATACYHRVVCVDNQFAGFLLAMDQSADYDSINFRWFADRYSRFIYIDRIVIEPRYAGQGLGRRLYQDLLAYAAQRRAPYLVCEYNLDPPNPASAAFHQRLGFVEVGQQFLAESGKRVSMQRREVENSVA